jgi:predicted small secreted protein
MKSKFALAPLAFLMVLSSTLLTSCEAISGIFKAGAYSMLIFIVIIVAVIIFIIAQFRKRS